MAATPFTVTDSGGPSGATLPALGAVDATNGNSFTNTAREIIEITNGGGASITATFVTTATYQGYAIADKAITIANGASMVIGPFDTGLYGTTVTVNWSSGTSVTARVLRASTTLF